MQSGYIPIRVFFEKRGRAKYISHLDTMRAFTRALGRSGLPLWHTEGFNPHLYITFALPLSLGSEGLCESFDVRLTREMDLAETAARMNGVLPPGFSVLRAAPPVEKPAAIAWADYEIVLDYGGEEAGAAAQTFAAQPVIEVVKRTKKGEALVDIKPHMRLLGIDQNGGILTLNVRLAAGINLNIGANLFLGAFCESFGKRLDTVRVTRTRLLDKQLAQFL
ncbi:MAG: TIGR03936 family radical SAM-associated protein [Oscillospiraceae bacterium]|nr:TIGR03936 family radical SAM-associated protein [Oscillospiraceae bacterium]